MYQAFNYNYIAIMYAIQLISSLATNATPRFCEP